MLDDKIEPCFLEQLTFDFESKSTANESVQPVDCKPEGLGLPGLAVPCSNLIDFNAELQKELLRKEIEKIDRLLGDDDLLEM